MAVRHSHAAWCARNGVIVTDVTSEVTRMHAEHTSEASASSFCVLALSRTARVERDSSKISESNLTRMVIPRRSASRTRLSSRIYFGTDIIWIIEHFAVCAMSRHEHQTMSGNPTTLSDFKFICSLKFERQKDK
jgi:hypothetical protein